MLREAQHSAEAPAVPPKPAVVAPAPTASRRRGWRLISLAVTATLVVAAGLWTWYGRGSAPKAYATLAADTGTVAPTVIASGTANPVTTVQVGSYVSGVIQTLSCDFNTRVRAGQSCARIDARPYQSAVDQESANVATARAQLAKDRSNLRFAKLIFERDTDLLKRSIVSQETVDTAANAYQQAQSQIALDEATIRQRQAALDAARINLGFTNIASPVDGTVVSRNVTQGQTVAASFQTPTLFLIATDLTKMQVDTNVSESDIGRVAEGNTATFTVESFPDRPFSGTVSQVRQAPQTVQNVITYDVVVSVPNPALLLKPGMTASVRIVTQRHDDVLRVPDTALRYVPTGVEERGSAVRLTAATGSAKTRKGREAQVWVLHDGQAGPPRRVAVTIGLDDEAFAEVLHGDLRPGDKVVVSEHSAVAARSGNAPASTRAPRM